MKGLIGKKIGMTQIFDETGKSIPVTVIEAGPCTITQIKTMEKDGYKALQLGFGDIKEKKVNKPLRGHFLKKKLSPLRFLKEFNVEDIEPYKIGQIIKVDTFEVGEKVDIIGTSKGKGFAGAMKRWNFAGGPNTHGSMFKRKPASGGSTDAARTFRGKRGPGRMGGDRISAQGLNVIKVYTDRNLILVKGSVPGAKNGLLLIKKSVKK